MSLLDTQDLTNVETSYPVLAQGKYLFSVTDVKEEKTKNGKNQIIVKLSLEQPNCTDIAGKPVNVGYVLSHRINLDVTEKYTEQMVMQNLARFKEAVLGTKAGAFSPLDQYINKNVIVTVKVTNDDTYGTRSEVGSLHAYNA